MTEHYKENKQYLKILSKALDISEGRIKRDTCLNANIVGTRGHISTDCEWWYLYTECGTKSKWTYTKKALSFMEVHQDGDNEGILRLSRMPFRDEARAVRKVIGVRPRTVLTEEGRALLIRRLNKPSPEGVSGSLMSLNEKDEDMYPREIKSLYEALGELQSKITDLEGFNNRFLWREDYRGWKYDPECSCERCR